MRDQDTPFFVDSVTYIQKIDKQSYVSDTEKNRQCTNGNEKHLDLFRRSTYKFVHVYFESRVVCNSRLVPKVSSVCPLPVRRLAQARE
jgi:hypothetical protein